MASPSGSTRRLVIAAALLLAPSVAWAHTSLRRSEPAKDSRLTTSPARITLWFTARPQVVFSKLRLIGPAGDVPLGTLRADSGSVLYADIVGVLSAGRYRVEWQTASADGHPIRGEFTFQVTPATDTTLDTSVDTGVATIIATPADSVPEPAPGLATSEYRSARWMEFVALLAILGALGFVHAVLPPLASRGVPTTDASDRARRLGQGALVLYAATAIVRFYSESAAINGPVHATSSVVVLPMLTQSVWGVGWLAGMIGAAMLAIGWALARRWAAAGTPLALTGALGMVVSPALSGHAAASRHFIISVTLDMVHVAAAGVWLGGLLMVLAAGLPAMRRLADGNRDAAVSALVNSFHPLALFCAPLVVLAGIGTAWVRLVSLPALWGSSYGRTLMVKLVFVALVVGMGAFNALRARRTLGTPSATSRFRRSGGAELVLAGLVLVVTTYLVATPVPAELLTP